MNIAILSQTSTLKHTTSSTKIQMHKEWNKMKLKSNKKKEIEKERWAKMETDHRKRLLPLLLPNSLATSDQPLSKLFTTNFGWCQVMGLIKL